VSLLAATRTDANCVELHPSEARRRYGVPPGGPYDLASYRLALAALLDPAPTVWEVGFMGGEWETKADVEVVVFGAGRELSSSVFSVPAGGVISLGPALTGHRSYLACSRTDRTGPPIRLAPFPEVGGPIRAISENPDHPFFRRSHRASPRMNRLGIRLDAIPELAHSIERPSEPQCVGSIQITPDGTPILIGPDGPTLGGYPKVGAVISADLDRLGQVRPGDDLAFEPVTLEDARRLLQARNLLLEARCREVRTAVSLAKTGV
jgi:allophanate hydrolase subunit 2